jgi:hypothetical protein
MHSDPQISLHLIPNSSEFSSSGCAMTHRLWGRVNFARDGAPGGFSFAQFGRAQLLGACASIALPSTRVCRVKASLSGEDEVDLSTRVCTDQFIREKFSDKMP